MPPLDYGRMISLLPIREFLCDGNDLSSVEADDLGFVWSPGHNLLVFATTREYVEDALSRPNVSVVLVDESVETDSLEISSRARVIRVVNAKLNFFRLHNSLRSTINFPASTIHSSSEVHPSSSIGATGVSIGKNCVIESHVTIESGVQIGDNVVIRSGCRIGADAMDIKDDEGGNPYMTDHLGRVEIDDNVEIGSNSVIDRSIFRQTKTYVGSFTKMGCLVNISHGVCLGSRNRIASGVKICGSTVVGDDNWFGPGVIVSNLLSIGSRNYVALGSSVLSDLEDDWKVVGNKIFRTRKLF